MFSPLITEKKKARSLVIGIFLFTLVIGVFVYPDFYNKGAEYLNKRLNLEGSQLKLPQLKVLPFRLGLDVSGGTSLIYRADVSGLEIEDRASAMEGLKDVIERRINIFGVQEPRVEVARSDQEWRLIVELAGIKDIGAAIEMIGKTPFLEFKEERSEQERNEILKGQEQADPAYLMMDPYFKSTSLTGRFLKKSEVQFDQATLRPVVTLQFNEEGAKIFEQLTEQNLGRRIAIYIDGMPISAPIVQSKISDGNAQITGSFTFQEAKDLANNLNQGALPVPITLISQRSVGAILGADSLMKMIKAGLIGFFMVALFMIVFYRIGGFLSVLALLVYIPIVLALFKLIPVTLTLSGVAGFILSIGMAVDANILILERIREEIYQERETISAVKEGFARAWPSIRDSNITSIITALVLYYFTTSLVRGFALTLLIGVIVSMFSAIFVSRTLIFAFWGEKETRRKLWFRL